MTIVVNSTDSFADCWAPFFTLFRTYWPACPHPIVLITDTKDFDVPGLDVRVVKVGTGPGGERLAWGACLMRGLEAIDTDLVLYLQEDFFLEEPVDGATLERMGQLMKTEGLAHVLITDVGDANKPWHATPYPELVEIDGRANYRIALQAGLWRRTSLLKYLKPHESPWELERWGALRARRGGERFYMYVDPSHPVHMASSIYPYTLTGVIQGKWNPKIAPLFSRHGIQVDYSIRGFYRPTRLQRLRQKTRSRLRKVFMKTF